MVDLADIQAAYYMVAATGVLVAAVFYVLNLKATLQTRQAQLLMQVYGQFNNKEFNKEHTELTSWDFKDYDDLQRKYAGTPEQVEVMRSKINYVFSFYESVGALVYRKLLDPRARAGRIR